MKMMKFRKWICKTFGHSFSEISKLIFEIKTREPNSNMNATIKCRVCKEVFAHKDSHLV